jgi:bacterial/archaeal transporter family-2 protein
VHAAVLRRRREAGVSRSLAVLVGIGAGCLVGMQAPINSRLGKTVGGLQAASFSFLVGTALLVAIAVFVRGGLGSLGQLGHVPWWALVGGLLGAIYVFVALEAVRTLGASGLTAVVITGQLAISVAIDRFGLLGVARQPIGLQRVLGLALLAVGVVLVVRK